MYLRHKPSGDLVEVLSLGDLFAPHHETIAGRFHAGEEIQDPDTFAKHELEFPSGEPLPVCWLDPDYRSRQPA